MTNNIKHLGIVENIDGFHLKVRIVQTSACSSCSIKGHCSASETKEKLIDVYNPNPSLNPQVGQRVMITGSASMGMKAVGWAFIMPFLILLVSLFVSMKLTQRRPSAFGFGSSSHAGTLLYNIVFMPWAF